MSTRNQDNCQISDEKEEINNFNFRATAEESDELDSTNNFRAVKVKSLQPGGIILVLIF